MSIKEKWKEIKSRDEPLSIEEDFDIVPAKNGSLRGHILNISLIILFGLLCFGIGRISLLEEKQTPVRISGGTSPIPLERQTESSSPQVKGATKEVTTGESVVASKSGTKYHFPWCPGAKQISEKNKIVFSSPEDARKAGYSPAGNCKGLK